MARQAIELVSILESREFSFVLTDRRVDGYVHYSDLNHQMVKWTYYVMLEAVERLALESLRPGNEQMYLESKLKPDRFNQIIKAYKRAGDNGRSLFTYLNIADILRLAVRERAFDLDEDSIVLMKNVRDWASHVTVDLDSETAVHSLAVVKNECMRLLGETTQQHSAAGAP